MNCSSLIDANIEAACLGKARYNRTAVIINREDVVVTYDAGGHMNISIASGKKGYKIIQPANNPYTGSSKTVVVGTYGNTVDKAISFVVPIDTYAGTIPTRKGAMGALLNGEFVVVVQVTANDTDGSAAAAAAADQPVHRYEVIGLENGATITEATAEMYNEDTRGNWLVTLTETGATEPTIYAFAQSTGKSTTEATNAALDTWFASLTA